ncbi:MAG: lipolytic protein family [Schlesneria sp.]|nr:lipolytic protein family [Schlesneria sp.]
MLNGYSVPFLGTGETTGMKNRAIKTALAVWVLGLCAVLPAQDAKPAVDKWEAEIRKFEEADQKSPPAEGANAFIGSSSIRMWKLGSSFPNRSCLNRGFGGSEMADSARYVDRIVLSAKPKVIVLYAGDNDIANKNRPTQVRDGYRIFRDKVQATLPETVIVLIGLKPSPSRWKLREAALEANQLLRAEVMAGTNQTFVDVWPAMLGEDGMPNPELFQKDNLHMTDAGYRIWNELIEPHLVGK